MTEQAAGTPTTTTAVPQHLKPVALVFFEGTIVDENDEWKPDIWARLMKLRETHFVSVVSPKCRSLVGANIVMGRLYAGEVPFDDVFLGCSCPDYDIIVCDSARPL